MALTVSSTARGGGKPAAPLFVDEINILCDGAYPGGGWPITGGLLAVLPSTRSTILAVFVDDIELSRFQFQYDRTNDKLLALECAGANAALQELSNAAALNGVNVRLIVISK